MIHIHKLINDVYCDKTINLSKIMKEYIWYLSKTHYNDLLTLPITESGVSLDGYPYIKLHNGKVFYGHFPTDFQRHIYRYFLQYKIRKKIQEEVIGVAYDVLFRYFNPKLKMKLKQRYYKIKEGDTILELGAYIGHSTIKFSELVGENGLIISVEAVKENIKILMKNLRENSIKNVVAINKAVWNKPESIYIYIYIYPISSVTQ